MPDFGGMLGCLSNVRLAYRPGLYRVHVRKQALRVLLIQIGIRQTRHLLQYLAKWPTIEIALFLSEIMACMPSNW
jgi:hypothetical protein